MSQLTIQQIFGANSYIDYPNNNFVINMSELISLGLDSPSEINGIPILATLIYKAHLLLSANIDESVNALSSLSISSPSNRNGVDKTSFSFTMEFFSSYAPPTFDPDAF
jgi:hypothetical protein